MQGGLWVFGYGSLIWKPGFVHAERRLAVLKGYRRSFCMRSVTYRGTPESPGLVLALDQAQDAQCEGVVYYVPPNHAAETYSYLTQRELVTSAYFETRTVVTCDQGNTIEVLTYVVDPEHGQYAGGLPLEEQADIIARSHGQSGPNRDYLHNTVESLRSIGLHDPELETLDQMVRARPPQ